MCEENKVNEVAEANPAALRPKYRVTANLSLFSINEFETVAEALAEAQRLIGEGYTAIHILDNDDKDNQW